MKKVEDLLLVQALRVSGAWQGDDESLWYDFNTDKAPSEISLVDQDGNEGSEIWANKYGEFGVMSTVTVNLTPSSELKEEYPFAIVKIDGKEFDLAKLENPIEFNMMNNHRISIEWVPGLLVETFRVIFKK